MTDTDTDTEPATPTTTPDPDAADDRTARFTAQVAELQLKTGRTNVEHALQVVGVVLMAAGVLLALGAYSASTGVKTTPGSNTDVLNSGSFHILALAGVALSVVGGFVFLRYSLAQFLRFWLLRQSYEQHQALAAARADG